MKKPEHFETPIKFDRHGTHIFGAKGAMVAEVRGWGFLTGTGGLNLDPNKAADIQTEWGVYIEHCVNRHEDLEKALAESLKLQSHYAKLLNMHDGGERVGFKTVDEWIERLRSISESLRQ